jgi:hypothetical protein
MDHYANKERQTIGLTVILVQRHICLTIILIQRLVSLDLNIQKFHAIQTK